MAIFNSYVIMLVYQRVIHLNPPLFTGEFRVQPLSETPRLFIANALGILTLQPPFNPHVFPIFLRKRRKTHDLHGQLTSTAAFFAQAPGSASPPAHALWPASKTCWEQPKSGDFTVQKWWIHGGLISKHCDVARSHLQLWWLNVKNCVLTSQKMLFHVVSPGKRLV